MLRKLDVLVMVCMLTGIAGGVGLKHYLRAHRASAVEIRISTPPDTDDDAKPEYQPAPASATNSVSATTNDTAMNSR